MGQIISKSDAIIYALGETIAQHSFGPTTAIVPLYDKEHSVDYSEFSTDIIQHLRSITNIRANLSDDSKSIKVVNTFFR